MKIIIASDIHGSAYWCAKLLEAYRAEGAKMLLLLGDVLYHGPRNNLPDEYDPKKVIAMLNEMKSEIICVRGNCDTEVDQMVLDFPILSQNAVVFADGVKIYATHGHKFNKDNLPPLSAGDVLAYGHTHVALDTLVGGVRCLNPGSVSIPKENTGHGYIIFENGEFTRKLLY
ncbi:MAG: phosphodiesterase [Clostridia bacterium]|nr:phosphodiesterase [Clostridia bacterium]